MTNSEHRNSRITILLAGDIERDEDGVWRTSQYDHSGATYGMWRVEATAEFFKRFPNQMIIVSGGFSTRRRETCPSIAEVVKQELVKLGVPREIIIKEEESHNTYTQLTGTLQLCRSLQFSTVTFVTSVWAIERTIALYTHFLSSNQKYFQDFNIDFLSAEVFLESVNPEKWSAHIKEVLESQEITERIRMEQKGIEDIKNKRYKFI
jgi:uncharacterized SAM-binding protein YcdF (DUF218 family)